MLSGVEHEIFFITSGPELFALQQMTKFMSSKITKFISSKMTKFTSSKITNLRLQKFIKMFHPSYTIQTWNAKSNGAQHFVENN